MNIGFFRPQFLWALLLLAIPVAIHFFNRRRTLKLDFSSLRFFSVTAVKANRARNLRRILQLIARLGVVALLALLFARPHDPSSPFAVLTDPQCGLYTWTDRTVSMRYGRGLSRTDLAAALRDTLELNLEALGPLLGYDDERSEFTPTRISLDSRHGPARFGRMFSVLRERLSQDAGPAVLVVFSDMQDGTVDAIDSALAVDTLPCPMLCVDLSPGRPANGGIVRASVPASNPALIDVTVAAQGNAAKGRELVALLGGLRTGRAGVSLEGGDTARVELDLPRNVGAPTGVITLEPGDAFTVDDTCAFVREASPPRAVLIVGDTRRTYPIGAALNAVAGDFWQEVTVRDPRELTIDDLDRAALIVLDSIAHPSRAIGALLSGRSLGRKAILLSPALAPGGTGFVRTVLQRTGFGGAPVVDSSDERGLGVVLSDTLSAVWRGFPRLRDSDVAVYRWLRGVPGRPMLRLDNGKPLVTVVDDTAGHVWMLSATPLAITNDNNLAETGFFVPLLDRLARYALAAASPRSDVWIAGRLRRNPYFGRRGGATVRRADGSTVGRWDSQLQVMLGQPGAYRVIPDGETGYWLPVVADPSEIDLSYRTPAVPQKLRAHVRVIGPEELGELVREAGRAGPSRLLWLLLVFFVLVEMLLWGRGGRGRPKASSRKTR